MRKVIVFIWLVFFPVLGWSASNAERRALSVPSGIEQSMPRLVNYLVQGERDKKEQAKAIAVWIAAHIAYDNYTLAAKAGKYTGKKVSNRLQAGAQTADEVFKIKIATCVGYADLYEKMLSMAGISSSKVYGFVLEHAASTTTAKHQIKGEKVGHVWNRVEISGRPVLVDITWMGSGRAGTSQQRLTPVMKQQELRQISREKPTYSYRLSYFDFSYADLQSRGEYRFNQQKKLLQR